MSGEKPTRKASLRRSVYAQRNAAGAIDHPHLTHFSAASCLSGATRRMTPQQVVELTKRFG